MKTIKITFVALFIGLSCSLFGQDTNTNNGEIKTLFNSGGNGAYGGLGFRYSDIGSNPGIVAGLRGCFVAGHSLAIGLGINGMWSEKKFDQIIKTETYFNGGYGGLIIEPILFSKYPVHVSFPILMGGGSITYKSKDSNDDFILFNSSSSIDNRSFFIIEPGAEVEINVLKFFRLAIGCYYRLNTQTTLKDDNGNIIETSDFLRGFSGGITLKLGKF